MKTTVTIGMKSFLLHRTDLHGLAAWEVMRDAKRIGWVLSRSMGGSGWAFVTKDQDEFDQIEFICVTRAEALQALVEAQ